MSVSRDARSGDSPDTLSARAGTFTRASSRLISLTRRVFSATSCINRSRWDDAWDRLSIRDRKSTRLNSSHSQISYAVFCLKKKKRAEIVIYAAQRTHDHTRETAVPS